MPTTSTSKAPAVSVSALATDLEAKLAASQSTTIYVPLDDGDAPTDAELAALLLEGLSVEVDVVRNALAVRAATEDEIAQAEAEAAAAKAATAPVSTSTTTSTSTRSSTTA